MCAVHTQVYELHLHEIDCNLAGDALMASGPELTVLEPHKFNLQVFSEANSESIPNHGLQDLAIEHFNSKQPPCGPIYNLSKKELDALNLTL
jgi:hypothetical protein